MNIRKGRGPRIASRFRGSKRQRNARFSYWAGMAYAAFYEAMKGSPLDLGNWRYCVRISNMDDPT